MTVLLSIEEAAKEWGVSPATARRMCTANDCPNPCSHCRNSVPIGFKAHKVGSTWVIEREET